MKKIILAIILTLSFIMIASCGGGGGSPTAPNSGKISMVIDEKYMLSSGQIISKNSDDAIVVLEVFIEPGMTIATLTSGSAFLTTP